MSTRWFPDLRSNLENQSLKEKTSCTVWMSPYLNLLICKYLLTYWRSRINSFLLLFLTTPNRMQVTWASEWLTSITRGKQFYDLFWNKTWFFQSKLVVFMCLKSFWPKPVCVQLWVNDWACAAFPSRRSRLMAGTARMIFSLFIFCGIQLLSWLFSVRFFFGIVVVRSK